MEDSIAHDVEALPRGALKLAMGEAGLNANDTCPAGLKTQRLAPRGTWRPAASIAHDVGA